MTIKVEFHLDEAAERAVIAHEGERALAGREVLRARLYQQADMLLRLVELVIRARQGAKAVAAAAGGG